MGPGARRWPRAATHGQYRWSAGRDQERLLSGRGVIGGRGTACGARAWGSPGALALSHVLVAAVLVGCAARGPATTPSLGPPSSLPSLGVAVAGGLEGSGSAASGTAPVSRVIDGDTFVLAGGERVPADLVVADVMPRALAAMARDGRPPRYRRCTSSAPA